VPGFNGQYRLSITETKFAGLIEGEYLPWIGARVDAEGAVPAGEVDDVVPPAEVEALVDDVPPPDEEPQPTTAATSTTATAAIATGEIRLDPAVIGSPPAFRSPSRRSHLYGPAMKGQ
jgi:hypothetical protein